MKTITVPVYSFSELSPDAKKKAIAKHRDFTANIYDDSDDLEIVKEDLRLAGYPEAEIMYSGFGSQGDGLSFTCQIDLDALKVPEQHEAARRNVLEAGLTVKLTRSRDFRYVHECMMNCECVDLHEIDDDSQATAIEDLCAWILEDARSQAKKAYRFLESCYFAAVDDEAVIESIEINGYDFHADGTIATATVDRAI